MGLVQIDIFEDELETSLISLKKRKNVFEETDNARQMKCRKKIKKSELGESSDGGEKTEEESKRKVLIEIESSSKKKGVRLRKKDFILISESKSGGSGKDKKGKKVRVRDIEDMLQQSSSLGLRKKENKVKSESTIVKWLTLQTRSSPNQLLDGIPSKLAHYVVDKFKAREMEIRTLSGNIKVDTDSIHSLLGMPKGEVLDDKVKEWRDLYEGRFVAPSEIVKNIESSRDEDTETYFRNIDWCDYIIENLKVCKIGWNRFDNSSPFNGSLTILTMLYVDSVECRKMKVNYTINQITFWTMDRLRIRERFEIKGKGFGKGRFKGLTISVNNQTVGEMEDISLEFQEEYISVLKKLDDFEEKKRRLKMIYLRFIKKNIERSKVVSLIERHEFILQVKPVWPQDNSLEETNSKINEMLKKINEEIVDQEIVDEEIHGVNENEMEDNNIDISVDLEACDNIDVNQVFQNEATETSVNENEMQDKNIDISVDLEGDDNIDVNQGFQNEATEIEATEKSERKEMQCNDEQNENKIVELGKAQKVIVNVELPNKGTNSEGGKIPKKSKKCKHIEDAPSYSMGLTQDGLILTGEEKENTGNTDFDKVPEVPKTEYIQKEVEEINQQTDKGTYEEAENVDVDMNQQMHENEKQENAATSKLNEEGVKNVDDNDAPNYSLGLTQDGLILTADGQLNKDKEGDDEGLKEKETSIPLDVEPLDVEPISQYFVVMWLNPAKKKENSGSGNQ
ncbi:hypothetical protein L1987_84597 [Smallanthus sonchifolius]|uniref:Uncharacterized protein n=1 Tax=Smallanthus sonchifolius TaxID=185202 RepID=A0ACB8XUE0_9ASTR|nr:hypothetical protein L1987_84597 [Smallanthus sonchifolius]